VSRAGTIAWVARHEWRLAWRDLLWMMTAGRRRRTHTVALGFIAFLLFMHGFAALMLAPYDLGSSDPDKRMLVILTGTLALSWSLMLSQGMEAVTRAFYARADFDLVLSSPLAAWRLFAVRIGAMALTITLMALALAAPFIDVAAWRGGPRWLGAYIVTVVLAVVAVSVALALTAALFRSIGPKRTRLVAQIIAAVIGAAFVIGLQLAAILSYHTISRFMVLQSDLVIDVAPETGSILWWPARAMLGDASALIAMLGLGAVVFGGTVSVFAPRFAGYVLTAAGVSHATMLQSGKAVGFRNRSPAEALRRKEWTLLWRDPWLVSQTLMQLLYLLPPAFLLWRNFGPGSGASTLIVPVLIMAAGQLAGALAWLAICGEDAPDLIASAPVPGARVVRAKTEAVMIGIALVFGPFIVALAVVAPIAALVACLGVAICAASATSIQIWFRTQAKRSYFRRRQTSSRVATFAEALSSCSWAATGALAAAGSWLAIAAGVIALAILGGTWKISPARN
jgi:ABC-2 type transport system permease protein